MKYEDKKCTVVGCNGRLFARKVCKYHYRQLQKPIKKKTDRVPRIPKQTEVYSRFKNQVEMFNHIWKLRPHVSELSDHKLEDYHGTDFWFNLFAHILPKGDFPLFRLKEENIVLLTPYEHTLLDHGHKAQRDKYSSQWGSLKAAAMRLHLEYKELDPDCKPLPSKYQNM